MRALTLVSLLVLAGGAAARGEAAPPKVAASPAPEWEPIFRQDAAWIGSDCAYSVPLGADRILWLFGDTFHGRVEGGKRHCDGPMARNTVAIQRGRTADRARLEFCFGADAAAKRTDFLRPPDGHGWFWFGGGTMAAGRLWVLLWHMERAGEAGAFDFRTRGTLVGEVTNVADAPAAWRWTFHPLPAFRSSPEEAIQFGNGILRDGEHVYVYGTREDRRPKPMRRGLLVARAPADRLGDVSAWRYFAGGQWTDRWQDATAFGDDVGSEFTVSLVPAQKQYVLVYSPCTLDPAIRVRFAPTPAGPWAEPQTVYRCPDAQDRPGVFCYAGKGHPELSPPDGLLVTYATNSFKFKDVLADARLYYPRTVWLRFGAP